MATSGLTPNSSNVFQIIEEATAGVYNAAGNRLVATSLRVEPQPETAYDSFKPQGWNARAWNAITREHAVLSGAIRLNFAQMEYVLNMLCGPALTDSGTPRVRTWEMALTGADSRITYTGEYGQVNSASRYANLLLASLSLNFMRMTENNEGSITLLGKKEAANDLVMTTNRAITGTDIAGDATITGTGANPSNATDGDGATDAVLDTGETVILSFGASKIINGIKVIKGATGGHASGVLALQRSTSGGALFTTTETVWSITDTDDGSWAVDAAKYGTFDGYSGSQYWRLVYTANSGSLAISEVELYQDAASALAVPSEVPLVPQMWTVRRASSLSGLGAASPISKVRGFALDIPDRTLLQWFMKNNDTLVNDVDFSDFVQGEGDTTARLTIVNDTDSVVAGLLDASRELPATPEWWRFKAQHPDLDYALQIDGCFACSGNIPYGADSNVRHREFPLTAMLNEEGFLLRFTLTTPS